MIIKKVKSSPALQQKLIDLVVDSKATIQNSNRQTIEQRWNRWFEIYRGILTKGTYAGRANLDWASAFIAIETLVPRIFNTLFPHQKWFTIDGVEHSDRKQAKIIEEYLKVVLDKDIHFRSKMIPFLRYMAINGTLICKTPFRYETKQMPTKERTNIDGADIIQTIEKQIVTFDSIDLQLVDLFDFFPADDTIEAIEDQPFVIHQSSMVLSQLKKQVYDEEENPNGAYENIDKIETESKEVKDGGSTFSNYMNPYSIKRRQELGIMPRTYKHMGIPVDIDEYQGLVDIDGEDQLYVITVANRNTLIQAEQLSTPDLQKTYVKGVWIDQPNEFWGMSVIERVETSIYELNDRVNQTMDATGQIVNPMYINTDAYIPEGKLRVFPGRIVKAVSKDGLTALHPPTEILTPAYNAIQTLVSLIQDVTGATRFLGGSAQTPELQRTASGISSIIREANARINIIIQSFEETFIKEFLRKAYKYAQFYASRERVIRIVGKHGIEYQKVNPADIVGDYDFKPLGTQSQAAQEVLSQQMINFLNILSKIPQVLQQSDIMWLVQRIAEQMLGFEDAEEILGTVKRQEDEIEKAQSENLALLKGIPSAIDPMENHRLHIQIHSGILQDPRFQQAGASLQLIQEHIQKHTQYEQMQGIMPLMQPEQQQSMQGVPQPGVPAQEQPRPTMDALMRQAGAQSQQGTL